MRRMATTAVLLAIIALTTIFAGPAGAACNDYGGGCPTASVNDPTPANGQTVFIDDSGLQPGDSYAIEWGPWRVTGVVPANGIIPFTIPNDAAGTLALEIKGPDGATASVLSVVVEQIVASGNLPLTGSSARGPVQLAVGLIGAGAVAIAVARSRRSERAGGPAHL